MLSDSSNAAICWHCLCFSHQCGLELLSLSCKLCGIALMCLYTICWLISWKVDWYTRELFKNVSGIKQLNNVLVKLDAPYNWLATGWSESQTNTACKEYFTGVTQRDSYRIYTKFCWIKKDFSTSSVTRRTSSDLQATFFISIRVATKNIASKTNAIKEYSFETRRDFTMTNELVSIMKKQFLICKSKPRLCWLLSVVR